MKRNFLPLRKSKRSGTDSRPSWRDYQSQLKSPRKKGRSRWLVVTVAALVAVAVYMVVDGQMAPGNANIPAAEPQHTAQAVNTLISKTDVQLLLSQFPPNTLMAEQVGLPYKNQRFNVRTSLDLELQNRLTEAMDRKNSRYIGIVTMEADSGRILTMAGFDKTDPDANPCLQSAFPAASLFKIVTAAAAVDQCAYSGSTRLTFNGYKHTLYKRQLKESTNRYTNTITFADSFAQSVNPIFGKIGTLYLGKSVLEQYGLGFGFNQPLDFELSVPPSNLEVGDRPYHWAEIASGFNNDTTLSPLHAAVMVSAVLNDGRMVSPTLVERIEDGTGREIYHSQANWQRRAMTSRATEVLAGMMEKTVQSGTARRLFRGSRRDPVLSHLRIGGKTGSIFNRSHDARFDWFVGFAQEKSSGKGLIVAVLVAHEEYIGRRAGTYARMAMSYYFKDHLARQKKEETATDS